MVKQLLEPRWPGSKVSTPGPVGSRFKPDPTEEPPCKRVWCPLNTSRPNVLPLVWYESLERGCQLKCRPRHLIAVQNDEFRPKIAFMLLQNGT
ncbi:hypothetical protein AVEN_105661-1 [Araneus ventricosus]|uniref:Uncharacterized protein n=1 Tax=Araneus ventricosus TaxID=182803 RepID=A0A4Y2RD70_ARAVE|nr:hypothetical protein AVEN_105661-1 [Araneus ventricosus]